MPSILATAAPPASRPARFRITNPRGIQGGQLIGSFDLTMPSGVTLLGCKLFNSGGTLWVKPPDAPRVDREGRAALKPDGKRIYDDVITFTSAERRERWREQTLAALAADAPELLDLARSAPPPPAARPAPRARDDDLIDDAIPF